MTRKSRTVALCCLANFVNAADRVLMPIAIVPMSEQYRWSLLSQGWILSAFAVGYITSQLVGSSAPSRYGGRTVMAGAVLLWSASTLVTPLVASSLPLLLLCRALLGLGEGLGLPCMFHVVGQAAAVPEERSRAVASVLAAGAAGQTAAALVCPHLEWHRAFYGLGALGIVWTAAWMLLHRDDAASTPHKEPSKVAAATPHWLDLVSHWPLWSIYIAHFAMNWSSYTIMQWLPTYLARALSARPGHLSLAALPYVCNSLCGLLTARAAELAGRQWSLLAVRRLATSCLGLLAPGIGLLAFAAAGNLASALFIISCAMGLLACNSAGHLANHADVAPTHAALTFSVSNTLATIPGILCGPLTAELVTQSHGRWFPVFVLAAAVNFVGAVVYGSQSSASQVL
ncbi:hypothetical protein V5799_000529 [Amblyomma americanum]|uniref:Major facilitator superfamily (MFS) profile domain-containing protein n=1 Tax=Amblyomma americanum TaxID=6943 RepID=A0AAQ4D2S1_AMBAM